MGVRIDKAGSDDQATSVDRPFGSAIKLSDFRNPPVDYSNSSFLSPLRRCSDGLNCSFPRMKRLRF
jgi:hypothetical protein